MSGSSLPVPDAPALLFLVPLPFFLRIRCTPVRGSTESLTVQYEPLPLSVNGLATFSKHGFRERL